VVIKLKDIKILNQFEEGNKVYIVAKSTREGSQCPKCGFISNTRHSKYTRKLFDGTLDGISKEIILMVSKYKCKAKECTQKIFTERLSFADAYARFTINTVEIIKTVALCTSAEKTTRILSKLGIQISHDSVIRILKKLPNDIATIDEDVVNIGIDDFAFKKSKNYCTLICDMDKKIILDILPSRSKETVSNWLENYPKIRLVSRDGSISYAAAIRESLPEAVQVSDKFHLIKNLLDYVRKYLRRKYPSKLIISDFEKNKTEHLIADTNKKNLLREEKIAAKWALMSEVKEKHKNGTGIKQLARDYSMSRVTIRKYLVAESPIYWQKGYKRGSKIDKFKGLIIELLNDGNTHHEIFNILKQKGYDGSRSYLSSYMSRNNIKKNSHGNCERTRNKPRPKTITISSTIRSICKNSTKLKADEIEILKELEDKYPEIIELKDLIGEFKNLFKVKTQSLDTWIDKARRFNIPEINSFTLGIERDLIAVKNSTTSEYTNGLLEGMVNKVKEIKRTSHGRCNFELLRLKVLNSQEIFG
jgi:transposase